MRRVLLFAAFLLLLGLTTATAASFEFQAEDITSFSTSTTIVTPPPPEPPVPAVGGTEFFMINAPETAALVRVDPMIQNGNEKASLAQQSTDITTEARAPLAGGKYAYVTWSSSDLAEGLAFTSQRVRVVVDRTAGSEVVLTAGLFACTTTAPRTTVISNGCTLLVQGSGAGDAITLGPFSGSVPRNQQLRLKMVNTTSAKSDFQWGYNSNNRDGRIRILMPGDA